MPGASEVNDGDRALSREGRIAASQLAEDLSDEPIGSVFSSPYRRALETVEPIAIAHGLAVRVDPDLRERRLAAEALSEGPFLAALQRSRSDPTFALPGGESTGQVLDRVVRVLRRMSEETPSGIVVAGTHGGLISILRWHLGAEFTVEEALAEPMPATYTLSRFDSVWKAFG